MKIKIYIKHIWKKLFVLPSNGPFRVYRDIRDMRRQYRLEKIRKEKARIAAIYDLSEMD